ncbi:very large A-kinase anchor protein [Anolis sagrei]|uniref:very large A-kinase anchor protein n=1 Tax=Anolis sagrei TaxID=38937 RepID=UPI00351FBCF1
MSGAPGRRRTGSSFWQNSLSRLFSRSSSKEEGDKAQGESSFEAKANESTNVLNERKESDPLPELLKFAVCENKNLSTEDLSRSTTQEEIKKANSLPSLAHESKTTHNERQVKEGFFQYLGSLFGISSKSSLKETEQLASGNEHDRAEKDFASLSSHQESGHIEPEIFVISTSQSKQGHSDESEDINFVKRPNSGLQNLHKGREKFPESPEKTTHELGAASITYATYRGSTRIKQLLKKQAELEQEKEATSNISSLENKENEIVNIPDSDMTIRQTETLLKKNSKAGTEGVEKDSHSSTFKVEMDPQNISQDIFDSSKLKNSVLSTEMETINNWTEDLVSMKTVSFSNTPEVNGNLLLEPTLLPKEGSYSCQNTDPIRMSLENNRLAEKRGEVFEEIQMQHPSNNATIVGFQKEMHFCTSSNTETKETTQLEFPSRPKVDPFNNEQQLVEHKYCCNNWTEDPFTLKSTNQELYLSSTIASGKATSQAVIKNEDLFKNAVAEQNEQSLPNILPNNLDTAFCKINSNKANTVSVRADVSTLVQPSDTIQGMDVLRKSSESEEDVMSAVPRGIQNSPSPSAVSEIGIDGFPTGNLCVPVVESEHVGITTLLPNDTIGNTNTSMLAIRYENMKAEMKATALEVKDTSTDKAGLMTNAYLQRLEDKKGSSHHLVKKDKDETLTNATINLDVSSPTLELEKTALINNTESGVMVNYISSPLNNTEDIEIKSLIMATESNIPLVNQTEAQMNLVVLEPKEIISMPPSKEMCLSKDFSVVEPENNCSSSVFPSHSLRVLVNKPFICEADNTSLDTVSKPVPNFEDQSLLKTSHSLCHEKEGVGECTRAPAIIDFAEIEYGNIDSDPTRENTHVISKQKASGSLSTLLAVDGRSEDTDGVSDSFLETDSTLKTKIVSNSSEVDTKNKISSCLEERRTVTDTGSVDSILLKEDPFLITLENMCNSTSATSTTCPKVTSKLSSPTCETIDAVSLDEIGSLPRNSEDALDKISPEHESDSLTSEFITKAVCPPPLLEPIAYDMEAIEPVEMILGLSFAAHQSKQDEKTPSGQLKLHCLTDVSEHPTESNDQAITKSSSLDFEEPRKYVETGKQVQIKSHNLTVLLKKADEIVDSVLHLAIEEIRSKQTAGVCQTHDIKDNLLEASLQKDQNIIKKLSESKGIQSKNSSLQSFNESCINKISGVKEEGTLSINIQDKMIAMDTTDNPDLHSSIALIAKEIIDDVINAAKQKLMYDLGEDQMRKAVSQNANLDLQTEVLETRSTDTELTVKRVEIIGEPLNLTPAYPSEIHKIIIEPEVEKCSSPLYVNIKKDNKEVITGKIVTKNVLPCQKNGDEWSDPAAAVEFSDAETGQSNNHKGAACTPQMINADDNINISTATGKSEKSSHVVNGETVMTEVEMTCQFEPENVPPFNPNVDTYTCMFSKSKDECEPSLESNVVKELPQYICQDESAMLVREPNQNHCETNNERDLGEINQSCTMLQDKTVECSMTEVSVMNNSTKFDQNPDFLHKDGAVVGPDLSISNVLKAHYVDFNDDRDGEISPKLSSFSAPEEWEGNSSFTILYEDALHTDGDESYSFSVEQPEKHFYVPNLPLDNSQHFVMCGTGKSIFPFEENDQSNQMLESTSSESFLTVEAKRFRVYPFSLSPIYEDDSSQEDLLSTDNSPGDNLNEKTRNNQSLSVLSLLQSVSERLQFSDQCQEDEEEEACISSHWADHSTSIVPEDIYEKALLSKHSRFLSKETFSTKEALSFSPSCSAQLLQDFDHGVKSSSKSIYYESLQSTSSYEGEKGTQIGSILLSRDQQPENSDFKKLACFQACPVDRERLKCNPRPGKMIICDVHGKTNKYEIYHDVIDVTDWVFSKEVLIRVIRGCWVLCEKPGFQGQKYFLEEGEQKLNDILNQQTEKHKESFTIGSIRQILKNCSVPEIQLYSEGRTEYFPISIQSSIADVEELEVKNPTLSVKAGVWFAYSDVNYKGEVMVLEENNCPCEISTADIKSLYPLKMGSLKVQMPLNVQIILYERPHFGGWCKELSENIDCVPILFENAGDFQGIGSIRVIGGIWVAYEKERYKGQQYLLEEGEYEDWPSWGGMNSTLLSFRFLQANFMESAITLFETDEEDRKLLDIINEEIPDLEVAGYGLVTRSINVKSGVWVAYQQKHFCGEQYVLEKGKYKCFFDWGGSSETIMSIRPVKLEPLGNHEPKHWLKAFSNTHFQGTYMDITTEVAEFDSFSPCSFKVLRGCWLLHYQGSSDNDQCVLEEDLYTDLASCGCPAAAVKSLKPIEYVFAEPFISLFALENCEGREWHLQEAVGSVVNKDLHFLTQSVWVKSGLWIAYEGCNFVGKQFLLTPGKISNWTQFSGWKVIGSLRPVKQPAVYFRIKNRSQDRYLTVAGNLMDARASSVCLSPLNGKNTQIWCYSCGLIKSKVNDACLDVIGGRDTSGAKVALWVEHGKARQKWTYNKDGTISSYLSDQLVLDIKGGCYYDRNHIIVNQVNSNECTQKWDVEIL